MTYYVLQSSRNVGYRGAGILSTHPTAREAYEELDLLAECRHSTPCQFEVVLVVDENHRPVARPSGRAET